MNELMQKSMVKPNGKWEDLKFHFFFSFLWIELCPFSAAFPSVLPTYCGTPINGHLRKLIKNIFKARTVEGWTQKKGSSTKEQINTHKKRNKNRKEKMKRREEKIVFSVPVNKLKITFPDGYQ